MAAAEQQGNPGAEGPGEPEACVLRFGAVRGVAATLQAIKSGNKQVCSIAIDDEGLHVFWEEDSKAMQSAVTLKRELFSEYQSLVPTRRFGVQFHLLLDALHVFSSMPCQLNLLYPDANGKLVCEMTDESESQTVVTYARISAVQVPVTSDLVDYWVGPDSYFMAHGGVLKEAMEDLEWPGADVEVIMEKDPPRLRFEARGTGDLEIELAVKELMGFHVASGDEVRRRYKYKNLRASFCNLPHPRDCVKVSSKVSIDSNGLLNVLHIVTLHNPLGDAETQQRGQDSPATASLRFMLLPCEDV